MSSLCEFQEKEKEKPSETNSNLRERSSSEHLWFCCVWFAGLAELQRHFLCVCLASPLGVRTLQHFALLDLLYLVLVLIFYF
jgi:hypothetical protein